MDVGSSSSGSSSVSNFLANENISPLIGDVGGHVAIMVEHMTDNASSFIAAAAAKVLKEGKACKIYVMTTHGLLSSDAPRLLDASPIDEVDVTNAGSHEFLKLVP